MKKIIALLLALSMLFALTACGGNDESTPTGESTEETTSTTESTNNTTDGTEDSTQGTTEGTTGSNTTDTSEPSTTTPPTTTPPTTPPTTEAPHTHSYSSKVTTAATCGKEGIKTFTCSCGSSYTEKIAATSQHSWKDATCTTPKTCKTCGKIEGTTSNHNYKNNATCINCGTKNPNWEEVDITLENWSQYFEISYNQESWYKNEWDEYVTYEHYCVFKLRDKYKNYDSSVIYEAEVGYSSYDYWIDFNAGMINIKDYHCGNSTIYYRKTSEITRAMSGLGGIISLNGIMGNNGVGTNYADDALSVVRDVKMLRIKGTISGAKE